MIDMQSLTALARKAGDAIMKVYDTDFSVSEKSDHSPLTEADMAAHHIICDTLAELTPDIPVLSEESASIPFSERQQWQRYWLIDPLDGTREFVKRNGEFTVNIALIDHHQSVLGVIYAPVKNWMYYASRGNGAFKQTGGHDPVAIHVTEKAKTPMRIAGSRSHAGESLLAFLKKVGEHELLPMGSSLKSCLVAEGVADLYVRLGPTSEWDTGAAQCIVEEAGGRLTQTDLQQLQYNTKDSLLNPHFLVFGDHSIDWKSFL
ncbi:MAG: 3'(2'),5'-bisphosphate nucleotidase CysQ [gamma proteobacterium symbiont of Bathyaustriella thionipta]|nr:3'(2'),5'-bisphosphate nucleotidase CysQ [gamma proteobacterium symbiont of Bathyaustriella thionipta]